MIFCNHRRFLKPSDEIPSWIETCYGSCSHTHPQIQLLQQLEQLKQVQGYGAEIPRPHPRTFEQPEQTQGSEGEQRQQDEVVQFKQSSGY